MINLQFRNFHAALTFALMTVLSVASTNPTALAQQRAQPEVRPALSNRILLYVDDAPISEARFNAKRALVAEQQKLIVHQIEPSQEDLDTAALSLAIQEQVLLNEAKARGIEFSDAEIIQRVRSMQDAVEASGDEDAKTAFHWGIAHIGLKDADFASDPRVMSAYREAFTLGEIRWRIAAVPLPDQEGTAITPQDRIERFVQRRRASVRAVDPSITRVAEIVRDRLHLD